MTPGVQQGILVVDKPSGPTSHDVVACLRRIYCMRQVGHCGTLDPLATGVLVICLGQYTRLSSWLSGQDKEYLATLQLGAHSDTGDAQGCVVSVAGATAPEARALLRTLSSFVGQIEQVPPAHSAIHVRGQRAYQRARGQQPVALPPRCVWVRELEVVRYEYPTLVLRVACSKGTYVRSLAADLGAALGCGAHVVQLRRVRSGALGLQDARTLEALAEAAASGAATDCFVSVRQALSGVPEAVLTPAQFERFAHGGMVGGVAPPASAHIQDCAVYGTDGVLGGIGRWDPEQQALRPLRVLRAVANARRA
ncbi:MAG: tRNA pseudouridine(55) synthase TruB [Candidatus Latescibacterota bacterium]